MERAIENSLFQSFARQHRNFDEETGLPNATYLAKRIHEEIARNPGVQSALAIATCQIENLDEIEEQGSPAQAHRLILQLAELLRAQLRDFDVLGRTGRARYTMLLPEPGHAPDQRIAELAHAVAEAISKDDNVPNDLRVTLAFGHAVYPVDGRDRETLLARAEVPRIRMV